MVFLIMVVAWSFGPSCSSEDNGEGRVSELTEWCLQLSKEHPDGFTVNLNTRELVTEGIVVAYAQTQGSEGKEGLCRCVAFALSRTGIVGGWQHDEKLYFDADTIFDESMLDEAVDWGRRNRQYSVFILSSGTEVLVDSLGE